jgi:hypothetical protein
VHETLDEQVRQAKRNPKLPGQGSLRDTMV